MTRRSVIAMLVGILASIAGLLAATRLRADRCLGRGGQWDEVRRACRGAAPETAGQLASAYAAGAVVALVAGFMLWRLYRYAIGEGPGAPRR